MWLNFNLGPWAELSITSNPDIFVLVCRLMNHQESFAWGFFDSIWFSNPRATASHPPLACDLMWRSFNSHDPHQSVLKKKTPTSAERWREVPLCSAARWHYTCEDAVSFQYKTWLTAVSDLVPHVVPRAMNDSIGDKSGGATRVAGEDWNTEKNNRFYY